MKTTVFLIGTNPQTSRLPAEAVRMAAGISGWKKVRPIVVFSGPACACVEADADILQDGEVFTQYLPGLAEEDRVYVLDGSAPQGPLKVNSIQPRGLFELLRGADYLLRF